MKRVLCSLAPLSILIHACAPARTAHEQRVSSSAPATEVSSAPVLVTIEPVAQREVDSVPVQTARVQDGPPERPTRAPDLNPDKPHCHPLPKVGSPCRAESFCVVDWGSPGGSSTALWCKQGSWQQEEEANLP